jgi:hypothetical protein
VFGMKPFKRFVMRAFVLMVFGAVGVSSDVGCKKIMKFYSVN